MLKAGIRKGSRFLFPPMFGRSVNKSVPVFQGRLKWVLTVFDAAGVPVRHSKTGSAIAEIDTNGLKSGVYLIQAECRGSVSGAKFIVKQRF